MYVNHNISSGAQFLRRFLQTQHQISQICPLHCLLSHAPKEFRFEQGLTNSLKSFILEFARSHLSHVESFRSEDYRSTNLRPR